MMKYSLYFLSNQLKRINLITNKMLTKPFIVYMFIFFLSPVLWLPLKIFEKLYFSILMYYNKRCKHFAL